MAQPAIQSVPPCPSSRRPAPIRPAAPMRAVALSDSEYESLEEGLDPGPDSRTQPTEPEARPESSQSSEHSRPSAALPRRSKLIILSVLIVTLCAVITGGAFALVRSDAHPTSHARTEPINKAAPVASLPAAHADKHAVQKTKSPHGAKAKRAPSSRSVPASAEPNKGKTQHATPAAKHGKKGPPSAVSVNGKKAPKATS